MRTLKHVRLVLIVRDGLNVHILTEHMDSDLAIIWVKIGQSKKNT